MEKIITNRLLLRPWKIEDCEDLYEYGKDEEVRPNVGGKPNKSVEESKKIIEMFIKNNDSYAIVLKEENKVIGGIGLHNKVIDERVQELEQREIGYVLNPKYWGNGYVPEAVKYLSLISKALKSYQSVDEESFDKYLAIDFCNYMLEAIN